MEENRKLLIAGLVIILGGNTSGILNAVNPNFRASAFTALDAAKLEARMIARHRQDAEEYRRRLGLLDFQVEECFDRLEE